MKKEFCPKDCLFDPEDPNQGVKGVCAGCAHSKDVLFAPYQAMLHGQQVTVLGKNGDKLYVRHQGTVMSVSQ